VCAKKYEFIAGLNDDIIGKKCAKIHLKMNRESTIFVSLTKQKYYFWFKSQNCMFIKITSQRCI